MNQKSDQNTVSEIKITLLQNGNVTVDGPIKNFPLFRHMMNAAERAVLDGMAHEVAKKNNMIVKPAFMI